MTAAGLGALGARYDLNETAVARLGTLLEALTADLLAPTSVRDPPAALNDHLADSLVALELERVREARVAVDIGSGAGVPALPLAIAQPWMAMTALESNARKCAFIERTAAACEVGNLTVAAARAESWTEGFGRFDLVTARALASLDVVAEYAAPLLELGGALVAWRGRRDPDAEAAAARAAGLLGLEPGPVVEVHPYRGAQHRHLHVLVKTAPTPPGFPRRPGIARKRPLGASGPPSDRNRR